MDPNDNWKLTDPAEHDAEVSPGDPVTDFRGDVHIFQSITRAPGGNSRGKILTDQGSELYPSVFGLTIVPRTPEDAPWDLTEPQRHQLREAHAGTRVPDYIAAPAAYEDWKFIDCGETDGTRYVDVLDEGDNPIEYGITLASATGTYGPHPVQAIGDLYE